MGYSEAEASLLSQQISSSYSGSDSQGIDQLAGALVKQAFATADTLVPLKALKKNYLQQLFSRAEIQAIFAGDVLFQSKSYDSQHIYLQHGEVELQYDSGYRESVTGGEMQLPLAHQQPRPCRAVAKSDGVVMRIDSAELDRILSWSQIAEYLLADISMERDLDEDVEWMQTILNSNLFFKVPPVNAEQIFSRLTPMVVETGDVIIRQGELGDCCYFIKEGDADVTLHEENAKVARKVAEIGPGRCFGEDALVFEAPRNATITMTSDGVLMRLEKNDFMLLLKEAQIEEITMAEIDEGYEASILIDVRSDDEYSLGHLAYSGNIPLGLLSIKKRLLAQEKRYVFYCDTGRRSRAAAYLMGKQGHNVVALKGGFHGAGVSDQLVTDPSYILRDGILVSGQ